MEKLKVKEIIKKEVWEDFLSECQEKTFLQSWNWGEFNKKMGNKIWRLGLYENDEVISFALVIKIEAKRGTFLLIPHGPILPYLSPPSLKEKILESLLNKLKEIAKEERASFIRIAPIWQRTEENIKIFKNLGLRKAPIHVHPELTWILDITSLEQDLLMQMRKTTRYLIRKGMKDKNLRIYQSQGLKNLEIFNRLNQETVKRHRFTPFSLEYLKNEFLSFLPDNQIAIFIGKYKDEVLASAVIIFWQGIAFYHQGASSLKYPNIPASYFLQWEVIKEAKRRGCRFYNFWGIADIETKDKRQETKIKKHPWWGLTLFKTGFGGQRKQYVKTQDLPLSMTYWPTYFFEKLRKRKRGF